MLLSFQFIKSISLKKKVRYEKILFYSFNLFLHEDSFSSHPV